MGITADYLYPNTHFKIMESAKPVIDVRIEQDRLYYHVCSRNSISYTILGDEPSLSDIANFINHHVPAVDNSRLQNLDEIHNLKMPINSIVICVEEEGEQAMDKPDLIVNGKTEDEILAQILDFVQEDDAKLGEILKAYESSRSLYSLKENLSAFFNVL
ncbi:MAG: hypothetical protein Q4C41_08010 [Eggerthellaceae bacterium]|nr:hypothetical protein [Eggerthellaceae bacterium]